MIPCRHPIKIGLWRCLAGLGLLLEHVEHVDHPCKRDNKRGPIRLAIIILDQLQYVSRHTFAERPRAWHRIAALRGRQCFPECVLHIRRHRLYCLLYA
jgi:hypothetical protein